jgi:hypothetical protein
MALRNITDANLLATIDETVVTYYELVHMDVGSGYYLTNGPRDIAYGGNTYRAFGQLLGIDTIEDNIQLEIAKLRITVSGIAAYEDGSSPATDFLELEYANKPVYIYRVYYNDTVYAGGVEIYRGYINGAGIAFSKTDSTTVQVDVASHWTDFARATGRFTNDSSQQFHFPGDRGFEYCSEVQKEIEWK